MKIYKLYKIEYCGGIGERVDTTLIGYYTDTDKAATKADKLAKDGEDIVIYYPNELDRYGYKGLYMDLGGTQTSIPYDGYVIEEIEVE